MPTGYTDSIKIDTPFPEFALRCARAFSALIMMRDDSLEAPIPDEFQPDTSYYDNGIAKAQTRLAVLADMTDEQVAADLARFNAEQQKHRDESMLGLVNEWTPPTPDHVGMKEFMQKQIRESIDFDCHDDDGFLDRCYPIFAGTVGEWREKQLAAARQDLEYNREHRQGEIDRAQQRTAWVKALRDSLKELEPA
jgi:hypothetical protein